jgi:predicted XRE-type DNA-binding protein
MTAIVAGTDNVYEDLGYPDAAHMQVKASLAAKIRELIAERGLTQVEASGILGVPQPKLSGMLRGQFRGISEAKMLECLNRLGRDVDIVVRKTCGANARGQMSVILE